MSSLTEMSGAWQLWSVGGYTVQSAIDLIIESFSPGPIVDSCRKCYPNLP